MIRWKKLSLLVFVLIAVLLIGYSASSYIQDNIDLGLDLAGGVYVLLQAEDVEEQEDTDDAIDRAMRIIQSRVDELGVTEPVIQKEGQDRIRIELAGEDIDRDRAMEVIGRTARLEFYGPEIYDYRNIEVGEEIADLDELELNPLMTGEHLEDAGVAYDGGRPFVNLDFTDEGTVLFRDATEQYINQPIIIVLDGEVVSSPAVDSVITGGEAVITGVGGIEEANNIALTLRSGALPVALTELESRTIGPSLGADLQDQSLKAGILGLAFVVIFMLAFYRLPGLMADFALVFYLIIVFMALISLDATFTLPGIAGLILSIGMAVDANVIIFERIKEEIRNSKSLRASVDAGFRKGIRTILDSNITTLIAAAVLFYFGTGPIRGFAVILSVGILASMLTAVVFTRFIIKILLQTNVVKNPKYFGIQRSN